MRRIQKIGLMMLCLSFMSQFVNAQVNQLTIDQPLDGITGTFTAKESIIAASAIKNSSTIEYRAATSIALKKGFIVEKNSSFKAYLDASLATNLPEQTTSQESFIVVYTTDLLTVTVTDETFICDKVEIISMTGKVVKQQSFQNGQSIYIGSIPTGIYILKLLGDNSKTLMRKIVVKKL